MGVVKRLKSDDVILSRREITTDRGNVLTVVWKDETMNVLIHNSLLHHDKELLYATL